MLAILMHGWVSAAHMLLVIVPTVPRRRGITFDM
jgi:hypothetical protein